jgi:NAD-dependent dihydropyrimidine dehydrogenase PreA subunit
MLIFLEAKKDCGGCGACQAVCPTGAIEMKPDEDGFFYPSLTLSRCVNCNQCQAVCPFLKGMPLKPAEAGPNAYIVRHKNPAVCQASTSGGVFTALSDYVLSIGGAVYGAGFGQGMRVEHQRALTAARRNCLRGSKYVQSNMTGIYERIRDDAADRGRMLFTGTPCQTAAVKKQLGKNQFFLRHFMRSRCHGVAAADLERFYRRIGKKIPFIGYKLSIPAKKTVFFRPTSLHLANGKSVSLDPDLESFNPLFYSTLMMRPACYLPLCPPSPYFRLTIADCRRDDLFAHRPIAATGLRRY